MCCVCVVICVFWLVYQLAIENGVAYLAQHCGVYLTMKRLLEEIGIICLHD